MSDLRQSGFTLIELTVAVAALAIMLAAVGGAMGTVNTTVETHSRSAEAATLVRRNVQRISGFARPARLATFTVQAVQPGRDQPQCHRGWRVDSGTRANL